VFAAQLSDALARSGHEVFFVGLFSPPVDALVPSAAIVEDLGGRPGRLPSYRLVIRLCGLVRRLRPDVVQANGSATLKYASLAKTISRRSWPLVYRNIGIASHWIRFPGQRWWNRWLLRKVGHVAAVSRHSGDDFRRVFGLAASHVSTIPIGVDVPATPRLPILRERLAALAGLPANAEAVIHVGSFTHEKNHAWLIRAFAQLRALRPSAHLVLVGDGPLRPTMQALVEMYGLREYVRFLGTRADVPDLVGGADILALSSTTEGIAGVILEAAAQAVPTVSTDVGSLSEAISDGLTGMLVPNGDMNAFVSAIAGLLADPARRRSMGDAAYAFVKKDFAIDQIAGRFERLYTDLADREP
jgi:glycosyltransferase involved in cell wall biosynthesis